MPVEPISCSDPATVPTEFWHEVDGGRLQCDVCPRACKLREGQRGVCFVRGRVEDQVVLTTYGRSSGFCIDPIEKKPLNHFFPGSSVLSFGTAGCNLACRFCQNWDISKSKQTDTLADAASPEAIATAATASQARSVAFTYNDPVIFLEYAVDTAIACHEAGVKTVGVTAGYVNAEPRRRLFDHLDAVNIDLKAFTEAFYRHVAMGALEPVLETIEYAVHETDAWVELTTLLIPGHNDSDEELHRMTSWVVDCLGPDVPMHFSAFHPDFKMRNVPATLPEALTRARTIALANGVRFAYTGNVHDRTGDTTFCPGCGAGVIERDWYRLGHYDLDAGSACRKCGTTIAGQFDDRPDSWGARRLPIRIRGLTALD